MVHAREWMDVNPEAAGVGLVVYGHSHRAEMEERNGVVYLNPGSAGPRRFSLPVTLAWVEIEAGRMKAEIVELAV
jgi:predicted phosphodiesterase